MPVHTHPIHEIVVAEIASLLSLIATFAGWLPSIATLAAIAWYGVCLWDSPVVARWRARWKKGP